MSQTPENPFPRSNPQRRDDWESGFSGGLYEGNAGKMKIERERDEALALSKANAAALALDLNGQAIMEARAHIKEHLNISAAFFDDVIHNAVATALQAQSKCDELERMVALMAGLISTLKPYSDKHPQVVVDYYRELARAALAPEGEK